MHVDQTSETENLMSEDRVNVLQLLYSGLGGHGSVVFSLVEADLHKEWSHSLVFLGIEQLWAPYSLRCTRMQVPYEYVHAKAGRPWQSWIGIYKSLRRQAPRAILLHSPAAIVPCALYCLASGAKLITVEHTPNSLKNRAEWIWSRLAQFLSRAIVCLTSEYAEELKLTLRGNFLQNKNCVIPNGIDTTRYERGRSLIEHGSKSNGPTLGMAARFSETKCQDVLIESVSILLSIGHKSLKLLLAGGGSTLNRLRQKVSAAGLDAHVKFCGNLDEEKLVQFYQGLDIYVHAAKAETMSTSLMQALSCGLPVIGSNVPGISNQLKGPGGILSENNPAAFAKAVNDLWMDAHLRQRMSEAARTWAVVELDSSKTFQMYHSLILSNGKNH